MYQEKEKIKPKNPFKKKKNATYLWWAVRCDLKRSKTDGWKVTNGTSDWQVLKFLDVFSLQYRV